MKLSIQSTFAVLAISLLALSTSAQNSQMEIGVEGGPNLLFLRGNDAVKTSDPSLGYKAGLVFQYNLSDKSSIRTSVCFEEKATDWGFEVTDETGQPLDVNITEVAQYITLPLLYRYHFGNKNRIFVNVGPYIGILVNNYNRVTGSDSEGYEGVALHFGNGYSNLDYGISAGFGINFLTINSFKLSAELRNDFGVHNIGYTFQPDGTEIRTNTPSVLVSAMIGL